LKEKETLLMMLAKEFGCREDEIVEKALNFVNSVKEVSLLL
jgi:hypothetical protein